MRQDWGDKRSTHDVDCVCGTGEAVWVVLDHVGGFEDALDGAGFDVELVVAEAVPPIKKGPHQLSTSLHSCLSIAATHLSSGEKFQSVTAP